MAFTMTYTALNGAQKLPYRNQYWNHYTLAASEPLQVADQTYEAPTAFLMRAQRMGQLPDQYIVIRLLNK